MRSYVFYASVKLQLNWQQKRATCFATSLLRGWGWGVILGNLGGMCRPVLQILPLFQTQKCHSPHPFSDLASNIIGSLSDLKLLRLESRHKIHSEFACYLSFLFIWELKQQKRSNSPIVFFQVELKFFYLQ